MKRLEQLELGSGHIRRQRLPLGRAVLPHHDTLCSGIGQRQLQRHDPGRNATRERPMTYDLRSRGDASANLLPAALCAIVGHFVNTERQRSYL